MPVRFVVYLGYQLKNRAGDEALTFNLQPEGKDLFLGRIGRPGSPERFHSFVSSYLGRLGADGTLSDSPYVYGLLDTQRGQLFAGLKRRVYSDRQLAHVVAQYNGPAGTEASWRLAGRRPGVDTLQTGADVKLPRTVDQYLEPRTDWQQYFDEETREPRQYRAGTTTHETFTYPTQPR